MNQYEWVLARFRPRRVDDLVPGATAFVGRMDQWQAVWIIESGPYAGQWAMMPQSHDFPFAWAPLCDLVFSLKDDGAHTEAA